MIKLLIYFFLGTRAKLRKALGFTPKTPFMKFREIAILKEVFENLKPLKCLEYGSGYSSNYFIRYLARDASWLSIEHDHVWYDEIKKDIKDPRVQLELVVSDLPIGEDLEDPKPFKSYIDYPKDKAPFDFILVDGRVRGTCIEEGIEMLADHGVLVVHDANKKLYQEALKVFPNTFVLEDYRRSAGGVGIGTKKQSIETLVSTAQHSQHWKIITSVANFFKFKWLIGGRTKPFNVTQSTSSK